MFSVVNKMVMYMIVHVAKLNVWKNVDLFVAKEGQIFQLIEGK